MNKQKIGSLILSSIIIFSAFSLLLECRIHFMKFEEPGGIYEYKYDNVYYQVIEGERTACIVGEKETIYVVKSGEEWKLPFNESSFAKYIKDSEDAMIYVYEYNKSDDYYIMIYPKNNNIIVSDSLESDFVLANGEYYGACVTNPEVNYTIYINENEHHVFE